MTTPNTVLATLMFGCAMLFGADARADAPELYSYKQLRWNTQPGNVYLTPIALNDERQVVANYADFNNRFTVNRVYFWKSFGSKPIDIGALPGYTVSRSAGMNNKGQIVGISAAQSLSGTQRAFLWDPVGGMQAIGPEFDPEKTQNSGVEFVPVDINDDGVVIGLGRLNDVDGERHLLVWRASTGLVDPQAGNLQINPTDINNAGEIVGYQNLEQIRYRGWFEAPGAAPISMGFLEKPRYNNYTIPNSINNLGTVVGTSGSSALRAFIWDKENGMRPLGTLGCDRSSPASINDAGLVVGTSCRYRYHDDVSFIWDSANGMRPLAGLVGGTDPLREVCDQNPLPVAINNRNEILTINCTLLNSPPLVLVPKVDRD